VKLKVLLPTEVFLDQTVTKVVATAGNGSFGLLPRHIDFTAALVPGLLRFETERGQEEFLAVDTGILVKCGSEVLVSTRNAARHTDLDKLQQTIEEEFRALDEQERKARSALARLEANFVQHFMDIREGQTG
jgi:F-type H+-transporting ATPase subunit epsilon